MKQNQEIEILVYADWYFFKAPQLVGKLRVSALRGKNLYSFEYEKEWLKSGISIDPELPLYSGMHYSQSGRNFGIFNDASPDRWGRMLMKRREVLLSKIENRTPRTLQEIDFLLGVHDQHRMGGLRFKWKEDEDYLSNDAQLAAPPWTSLRDLEYASEQYEKHADEQDEATLRWMNQLVAPGSSLGGARPKADVLDTQGKQWIAKFPSNRDDSDVGLWEWMVHELAIQAGITVPKAFARKFRSNGHTFLSQRFDRAANHGRIQFASAMTLLQRSDGDDADTGASYLELASFIKSGCTNVAANLEELFRRVLFSVCVSNTDDHLRNHGFLYTESGWTLSPAFDINVNESGIGLKLNIDDEDNSLDLDLVMSTAPHYLLSAERAATLRDQVVHSVANWRKTALRMNVSKSEIERKAGAFKLVNDLVK